MALMWAMPTLRFSDTTLGFITQTIVASSLELVQILLQIEAAKRPKLWLITQGAVTIDANRDCIPLTGLAQSSLWGFAKVIALEHPELISKSIDLDPHLPLDTQIPQLMAERFANPAENQIALHQNQRWVPRLQPDDRRSLPLQPYTGNQPRADRRKVGNRTYLQAVAATELYYQQKISRIEDTIAPNCEEQTKKP